MKIPVTRDEAILWQSMLCRAVEWIAQKDDDGAPDAQCEETVGKTVSVLLVADLFEISAIEVAGMVVNKRKER